MWGVPRSSHHAEYRCSSLVSAHPIGRRGVNRVSAAYTEKVFVFMRYSCAVAPRRRGRPVSPRLRPTPAVRPLAAGEPARGAHAPTAARLCTGSCVPGTAVGRGPPHRTRGYRQSGRGRAWEREEGESGEESRDAAAGPRRTGAHPAFNRPAGARGPTELSAPSWVGLSGTVGSGRGTEEELERGVRGPLRSRDTRALARPTLPEDP